MPILRSYRELIRIPSFKERFEYLRLDASVGSETFGFDRYMNQRFYTSVEWKRFRNKVIVRDNSNDMAHPDFPISGRIIIHHLNPLTPEDIEESTDRLFDMNNVICVSEDTHNAIHYGAVDVLPKDYAPRTPNDTIPWK